jgi:hypothetical protein
MRNCVSEIVGDTRLSLGLGWSREGIGHKSRMSGYSLLLCHRRREVDFVGVGSLVDDSSIQFFLDFVCGESSLDRKSVV